MHTRTISLLILVLVLSGCGTGLNSLPGSSGSTTITINTPLAGASIRTLTQTYSGSCTNGQTLSISYGSGANGPSSTTCSNSSFSFEVTYTGNSGTRTVSLSSSSASRSNSSVSIQYFAIFHALTSGANAAVNSLHALNDNSGKMLIGGDFTIVGTRQVEGLARVFSNGLIDTSFQSFPGTNTSVDHVLATNGSVYVAGVFRTYNGTAINRFMRVHSNGVLDTNFNVGSGFDSDVRETTPRAGTNQIYVGGAFSDYNGNTRRRMVRLNSNGSEDTSFNIGTGFDDSVDCILEASDGSGDLYVVGNFESFNGLSRNRVLRLNSDGSIDNNFNVGTGANGRVRSVSPDPSGDVYIAGNFTTYNGVAAGEMARLNSDGSIDANFDSGTGFSGNVFSALLSDGRIYVAGSFNQYRGIGVGRIARLFTDGTLDSDFSSLAIADTTVRTIIPDPDRPGQVYIAGNYTAVNSFIPSLGFGRLLSTGAIDSSSNPGGGANDTVWAAAISSTGDVYFGGGFLSFNLTSTNRFVRLNRDGSIDTEFVVGTGFFGGGVRAIFFQGNKLIVGGNFNTYKGSASSRIVRLDGVGNLDTSFDVGTGFTGGQVTSIIEDSTVSDRIYAGGSFDTYKGTTAIGLARLLTNGNLDTNFDVGTGFENNVEALAPAPNSGVYAAGTFQTFNGVNINRIVRLFSNGTRDAAFNVGTGFDSSVDAITLAADGSGDLYVGGAFLTYNGTGARRIVRLNSDGSIDAGFNIGTGIGSGRVTAIATAPDGSGDVVLGGTFLNYNGVDSPGLIRLNSGGSIVSTLQVGAGLGSSDYVNALVFATDGTGDMYAGGRFLGFNSTAVGRVVRINTDGSIDGN